MRIKAYFYENSLEEGSEEMEEYKTKETYGFKSTFNPPASKHLIEFEKEIINLITNIKYRKYTNKFQKMMKDDIENITKSDKIIVQADKTSNMYKMS